MTSTSKPIIFFGTEDFSLEALRSLVEAGITIAAVVTKPDSNQGRGMRLVPPAVKKYANEQNIPVWQPAKLSEITANISALDRPAGVLVSYGKIIPQSIINLFSPGIINVHPSLLPKYRGPSPIETAILNGDRETGVSIMLLTAEMDAGPVYAQQSIPIDDNTEVDFLYAKLGLLGSKLLLETLPAILDGSLQPKPQDDTTATYTKLIKKSDGIIDWNKPAELIEREIRAYKNWPGSRAKLGSVDVIITKAHAVPTTLGEPGYSETSDTEPRLKIAAQGSYLCIDALKPLGKKEMPVEAFLAGYRSRLDG